MNYQVVPQGGKYLHRTDQVLRQGRVFQVDTLCGKRIKKGYCPSVSDVRMNDYVSCGKCEKGGENA